ncbi:homocysteine S-methyltransferase family protein [Ornithinibacter sp.]|uniref:homocysteine S-methyltransferase family protein n=1 Tax=Ornithinibacter sp. TaxID=2862748 RepID=UPI002CBADA5A|nr:homocysteine S-methyltransferase family protein [Ornithinibacter sp.]HQW73819.1 homocysteine S-methyltransferase family protein [Ornithinibacter sp.]HRA25772.1 homocysteine S-methyltransferase family protein [Ornithinibacter sp.]
MTNRLLTLLADRPAVFDGGYGWLLQERGLPAGECAESWNVDNPDAVARLHDEYAAAGAVIITTNTFGATEPRLAAHGLSGRAEEVNRAGAAIAREVADRHAVLVAGDIGPTGELLEPLGTLTAQQATALFAEQVRGLAAGGADLILIETMSDLGEASAAVAAAREVAPDLPVVVTMSFDTNLRTMMGVSPAAAVAALAAAGADAVGANCGRGPDEMRTIAEQLVAARPEGLLLVAQSNAGLPALEGDRFVYTVGPEAMGEHAVELRDLGIDVIGACCGSSPEHIGEMAAALAGR